MRMVRVTVVKRVYLLEEPEEAEELVVGML